MRILVAILLGSTVAAAQPDAPQRITVEIDRTVEVEVGQLIGFRCDRPELIEASMRTRKDERGDTNLFVVKGKLEGTTACRVGGDALGRFQLFDVVVVAARSRNAR